MVVIGDYVFTGPHWNKTFPEIHLAPPCRKRCSIFANTIMTAGGLPREMMAIPTRPMTCGVVRGRQRVLRRSMAGGRLRAAAEEKSPKETGWTPPLQPSIADLFTKSQASYIKKLWNGEYFRYDMLSEYKDDIQADQLAGPVVRKSYRPWAISFPVDMQLQRVG